jgi:hypothetical protein
MYWKRSNGSGAPSSRTGVCALPEKPLYIMNDFMINYYFIFQIFFQLGHDQAIFFFLKKLLGAQHYC